MVLASGWRALMRCCQPVLPTPKATASDHQAQVPSFVGRVDEGEFNLEWKTATNDRVGCRRTTRDNTVCHQAMHLGDTCATPTAASEDIGSECDWTADDAAVVPSLWSGFDDEALMLQSTSAVTDPLACRSSGCESATRFRPLLLSDLLSAESSDEIDLELAMDPYEPVVLSLSLSQIDEEEISTETKSLCGCGQQRVCTPRVATTPENGAHDTRYLCWTPTPRSEEFDSESENGPCEAAAVPWSFSQTNEQRLYTSRTTPRDHRVTRQRTSRGRLFPSKAQLLSDLRLTLIEAIDQMDSRSAIVTGITGVDSSCFSRVEDGEVDFEDNGNCRVACPRRQHPRRRRRGRGRRRPIPCYTAEVEQVVHLPKDESTVDEITGIPYFIEDVNIEDICFYRVTANNRRVAHAQTPRERNILKNFLSNAMRHMLPPSVEDFYAMPTQITNGVRINGGPSILARGDEDEPEDQKALQDANSVSPGRATPGRKLRRKQAGTEKRCTYRVILRHQEIIVSSESEEDYDGPLSPVSEEDIDDTFLPRSLEAESDDAAPSGSEGDASDLSSAFAMSTQADEEAQDFDRDLRRVHSVASSRTSYSRATDTEPPATPSLGAASSEFEGDSDEENSSWSEEDSDDTFLPQSLEAESDDAAPSGSEGDASDLSSAFAMSTQADEDAQDFDRDLRRVHSVASSRTSYSRATDTEPPATPSLGAASSEFEGDSD
ncbi:hypothetical protein TGRUB_316780, partial [Toxoplasma gondii RUB]